MDEIKIIGEYFGSESGTFKEKEEWLARRMGFFTGSNISDLMKCNPSASKLGWLDEGKLFGFGDPAIRYIWAVGMERNYKLLSAPVYSKQMDWGIENEVRIKKHLVDIGNFEKIENCDFIEYKEENFFLGATPDGIATVTGASGVCSVLMEIKSTTSWDGAYKRLSIPFDDKHDDFWQVQTEMLVTDFQSCLYIVALPMSWEKLNIEEVKASEIHQKRLLQRVEIANMAIEIMFLEDKGIKEAVFAACEKFKAKL